jgi:hypothetical protein
MTYVSPIHNSLFSLTVSQALLIPTSASKFPKVVYLFEISTRYCCLPSILSNFLRWNLSVCNLHCLFTCCQSLCNFCHYKIVVNITICCPDWSDIRHIWRLSPVCQNMINLIVNLSIRRYRSNVMNVTIWEHCIFYSEILARINSSSSFHNEFDKLGNSSNVKFCFICPIPGIF